MIHYQDMRRGSFGWNLGADFTAPTARPKAIMAWSELVRDAVCGKLELVDAEDRARPFYRTLTVEDSLQIRKIIERLVNWKLWAAPANDEIDRVLADNKSAVKEWLKTHGLRAGYLRGAAE